MCWAFSGHEQGAGSGCLTSCSDQNIFLRVECVYLWIWMGSMGYRTLLDMGSSLNGHHYTSTCLPSNYLLSVICSTILLQSVVSSSIGSAFRFRLEDRRCHSLDLMTACMREIEKRCSTHACTLAGWPNSGRLPAPANQPLHPPSRRADAMPSFPIHFAVSRSCRSEETPCMSTHSIAAAPSYSPSPCLTLPYANQFANR
jgi:hypothetical protein